MSIIFSKLHICYNSDPMICMVSCYSITDLTGLQLHDIVWGAVRRLQEIALQVDCIVCDGGKPNRKFIHDHISEEGVRDGVVYKVRNMYDPTKFIYFMTDVPHLMKTTRNCWANSHSQGSRYLTVSHECGGL